MFSVHIPKIIRSLFPLLLVLASVSPAAAVDYKDEGGNYVGVQWHFEINNSIRGQCGSAPCMKQTPNYWVAVTKRINGETCNEQYNFTAEALNYKGKFYQLCGQPAIIEGASDNSTYYNVPGVHEGWMESPGHCYSTSAGSSICDHYWTVNW